MHLQFSVRMVFVCLLATSLPGWAADEPRLPSGLESGTQDQSEATPSEEEDAPSLPAGPGGGESEPALPAGLAEGADAPANGEDNIAGTGFLNDFTGFVDVRIGPRLQPDPAQSEELILGETRLQLSRTWYTAVVSATLTGDFLYDPVAENQDVELETGRGWFDLREASILLRPLGFVDVRAGRQILTWGVGDLVFLNDLFPKDFVSFFNGRDVEYLKAPSDALRVSLFGGLANLDLVYTPRFDPDRFITGERLSWFNPPQGRLTGEDAVILPKAPNEWFDDAELAARLYRNLGAYELAAYAYRGYWKSPRGLNPAGEFVFPELSVYGGSLRGPVAGGIVSAELAYYDSREDRDGTNSRQPNSEWRTLIGFEREVLPEFTIGIQYYTETTNDFGALREALPPGADAGDRVRHTLTLRLTKFAMSQRLTLNAFNFWSPNVDDGHLRLKAGYEITDTWLVEGGANLFYGPDERTFFGQLKDNSNLFLAFRWGY